MNKYNPKIKYIKDIYDHITGECLKDILQRYDNTELKRKVEVLRNEFNTLLNDNPSQAIENFNEIIAFLKNIDDDESLEGIIAGIEQQIAEINNDVDFIIEQHTIDVNNINDKIDAIKSSKVDKISGKQLSTNDYTTSEKNKLSDLPTNEELTQELETKANKNDVEEALEEKLNANTANTLFNQKVDKIEGKQLSTEDFTSLLKDKLEGLTNYDDTELTQQLNLLKERLDILVGSDDTTAIIDTFVEIENFLQGITNTKTLTGLLQEMKNEIVALIPQYTIQRHIITTDSIETDINNITDCGVYRLGTHNSVQNMPSYNNDESAYDYGQLFVIRGLNSDTCAQMLYSYKRNIPILYRVGNPLASNKTWYPWIQLLDANSPNVVTTNTAQDITSSKRYYSSQCFCNTAPDGGTWTGNMANGFAFYKNNVITPSDDDVFRFGVMTSRSADSEGNYNITSRRFVFGYGVAAYDPNNGCLLDISKDSIHYKNNTILHTGNYSTYALPRSGGDVTNSINIKYDTDTSRYRYYSFKDTKGNVTASIGFMNTEKKVYINPIGTAEPWNDIRGNYSLRIGENDLTYNCNKIWHEGNDGSGSGLDADTLDGLHTGYVNGTIPRYFQFPSKTTLVEEGYLEDTTHVLDNNVYLKALLKYLMAKGHQGHTLIGVIIPGARHTVIMTIYPSGLGSDGNGGTNNGADAELPRYSYGIYFTINGQLNYFGTYNGVYKSSFNNEVRYSRQNSIYKNYLNDLFPSFMKENGDTFSLHRVAHGANGIFPTSGAGSDTSVIMTLNRASATTGLYISQLGFSSNGEIYYKNTNNKVYDYNQEWAKLLTDKNYNTILDSVYVKKSDYDALLARIEALENK